MATRQTLLNITREQLAQVFPTHQMIRQFELLFTMISNDIPVNVEAVEIQAGSADARAQQALDAVAALSQTIEGFALMPPTQPCPMQNEVLTWIDM